MNSAETIRLSRLLRAVVIGLVLISTAGCDQATKHLARTALDPAGVTVLPGGFIQLILTENPGAFLSLGAALPAAMRGVVLTFGVALGLALLLAYLLGTAGLTRLRFVSLVLVWSGGMSNLIDRFVRHGLVTDFIYLRLGPLHTGVFNVADLAIVSGIALLILSLRTAQARSENCTSR